MSNKKNEQGAEVKALELPNYTLSLFYILLNVEVHGPVCRARNRLAQGVKERVNALEEERIKILEEYAEKGEDGKSKKKGEGEKEEYELSPENLAKYKKDFDELMHEKYILDLVPSVKADLVLIRPLVLESRIPLDTPQGYVYEEICKNIEAV